MTEVLPVDPSSAVVSLATDLLMAIVSGEWWKVAVAVVAMLSLVIRWKGASLWKPLGTVPGLVISSFALAFAGGFVNAGLADDFAWVPVLLAALKIAVSSSITSGGVTALWAWFQSREGKAP